MRIFRITFVLSVVLIIGGFLVPPMGIIDNSVLTAVGLLLMFATIDRIPEVIKTGKNIKVTKGDFSVDMSSEKYK